MSETLEKFSCTKKVEVALNLLEPAYVVEKVQVNNIDDFSFL